MVLRFRDDRGRFMVAPQLGRQFGMYGYAPHPGHLGVHGLPRRIAAMGRVGVQLLKGAGLLGSAATAAYYSYGNRTTSAKGSTMAGMYRRGRKGRAMPRRRMRRGRRTSKRFSRPVAGRRRGRRYTSRAGKSGKALMVNMSRNDRRSLRVSKFLNSIEVREGVPVSNNSRFICHLDHWTTQWARIIEAYEEFKVTDIQFVITPRSCVTGATNIRVSSNDLPYLCVRTVNPTAPAFTNINLDRIRATPGYRFLPLQGKKRFVQNVSPGLQVLQTVINEAGASVNIQNMRAMPWLKVGANSKALDLAAIDIRIPGLDAQDGDSLFYDISVYATLHFRGNNEELVDPY